MLQKALHYLGLFMATVYIIGGLYLVLGPFVFGHIVFNMEYPSILGTALFIYGCFRIFRLVRDAKS